MGAGSSSLPPEVRAEYHRSIGRSQTCWGRLCDDKRSCRRRRSALRRYLIPLTEDEQLRREVVAWRAADDRCRNGCCPRTPSDASLAALSRPGPRRPGPGRAGTRRALRRVPTRLDGQGDAARVGRAAPAVDRRARRRRRGVSSGGPGRHDPKRYIQQPRRPMPPQFPAAEQSPAPVSFIVCSLMITSETPSTRTPYTETSGSLASTPCASSTSAWPRIAVLRPGPISL